MNDLWFGLMMVSAGALLGGALGYFVYLLVKFMFPIG